MQNYLGRSDTGCVNSSDWKPSVLLDSLASVADPGHNYWSHDNHCHNNYYYYYYYFIIIGHKYWSHDNHCHNQRDPLRNHCHN